MDGRFRSLEHRFPMYIQLVICIEKIGVVSISNMYSYKCSQWQYIPNSCSGLA